MQKVIAFEFDGVCVENLYPSIGRPLPGALNMLRRMAAADHKLVLWTIRCGKSLDDAIVWFREQGIPLFSVNELPGQYHHNQSPKVMADIVLDSRAIGVPLLKTLTSNRHRHLDWIAVEPELYDLGLLRELEYHLPK